MSRIDEHQLEQIINALVEAIDPEQIILFGSQATDNADEESDMDLLIVEGEHETQGRNRLKKLGVLYRLLAPFHTPTDILLYSRAEIEYWRDSINHVVARALKEGKVIYERP